jgi:hypothetical protein
VDANQYPAVFRVIRKIVIPTGRGATMRGCNDSMLLATR